ncbi:MAG: cytochrome o ubiquinol oxidase subunit III [Candidatus Liptonbacteria bacterium]|nr:cytochrome o ubiquinol oxidase subunit III [Candidatus Liptonbacteria bacterium]
MEQALQQHNTDDKTTFGFWVYLMTDLVMFAALFATFAVLRGNTFGGPGGRELFNLRFALLETFVLLVSSFTCGLASIAVQRGSKNQTIFWFVFTLTLGLTFLALELTEFSHLIADGNSWTRNAFLSSFFALVGTHGLHIAVGLLWMVVAMFQIWFKGLTSFIVSKLTRLILFWHFLDLVWIFIFTIVYLYAYV